MIIPINVGSSSSNLKLPPGLAKISHDEVVLIELQGALEVESDHPSERDGKLVGELKVDAATNKPTLLIGHHLLEGKIVNIAKPLAVLLRSRTASNVTLSTAGTVRQDEDEDVEISLHHGQEGQQTSSTATAVVEWDMIALVKRKIVFSKRPMPVVKLTARAVT
ncbi:hypothetical protein C0993_005015 [Termitomyces sp. T159_Od127]|nr:hypothetical protein C0993_005015 [Termitomyces sp. T159_Od127]